MNFAVIGVGGYIAPRHLEAIRDLGHKVVVAFDTNDSVGIIDRYFPDCSFFTDFERFESFFDSLKGSAEQIDYVSICSPNYLHSSHIKFALSHGSHAICEKPLVLSITELDEVSKYERLYHRRVFTVLQLRVHDAIMALAKKVRSEEKKHYNVDLDYITPRGSWYLESWKGDVKKSGGLSTNIGVHFFDMLTWIFGQPVASEVLDLTPTFESGKLQLERATVSWRLSVDRALLPSSGTPRNTFRSLKIDGEEFEFSEGFTDLHKRVYMEILSGNGYGVEAARPAIAIVEGIRGKK